MTWLLIAVLGIRLLLTALLPALQEPGSDFLNFYTASKIVSEGRPLGPAYSSFTWFQGQMDSYGLDHYLGGFIPHPPPAALLFLPLATLDPLSAKRVWILANVALLIAGCYLLARLSSLGLPLSGLILLLSGPALENNLRFGQVYLLLLVSILAGLHFVRSGRWGWAGVCFGLLAPIKYVGFLWIAYFAWRGKWKLVVSASLTILAVLLAALWLTGPDTFALFLQRVLPRHLRGEIQNPFDLRLQTWSSLLRRLFLADSSLNPKPAFDQPALYFLAKHLISWGVAAVSIGVIGGAAFANSRHSRLFRWGWLALFPLLASPAGATYHFLLLTISVVFFAAILREQNRRLEAWGLVLFFGILNLPHYLWLEVLAQGWLTPFAYSRLWLLLAFAVATVFLFRTALARSTLAPIWLLLFLACSVIGFWREFGSYRSPEIDGARLLRVEATISPGDRV